MILVEETDDRFYIKESTIPNAGLGVFANVPLKKGDWLEIIGVQVKTKSVSDKCTHYANAYKFLASGSITRRGERKIDYSRKIVPLGLGGIVNHAPDPRLQNAEIFYRNGPTRNPAAGKAVYRFIRDIDVDEEILGNYGEEWLGIMDWADTKAEDIAEIQDDWETFLAHDLYNLGQLSDKFAYKE
jgi:hypothetical protein